MDEFTFDLTPVQEPQQFDLTPFDSSPDPRSFVFPSHNSYQFNLSPIPSHEPFQPQTTFQKFDEAVSKGLLYGLGPIPKMALDIGDWFGGASEWWKSSTQGDSGVMRLMDGINASQQALFGAASSSHSPLEGLKENYGYGDVMKSYGVEAPTIQDKGPFTFFEGTPYAVDTAFIPKTVAHYGAVGLGNVIFDPMNLLGESIAKGVSKIAGAATDLVGAALRKGVEEPVQIGGISSSIVKDIGQAFSKTAFRTDAEKTAQSIIDNYITERAVHSAEYEHQMMQFENRMQQYAQETGRPIEDIKREVLQVQETKLPISTAQSDTPLRPPMSLNPDFPNYTNSVDSLQPWLIDGLGMTRAEREIGSVKQAQEALINLGYRVPDETAKLATDWKIPEMGADINPETQAVKEQIFQPSLSDQVVKMGLEAKDWDTVRKATSAKIGFPEPELNDPWLDYALHRLTPEGEEWVVEKLIGHGYGRQYTPVHASQFARTLSPEGLTAVEMNKLTEAGQGESISKLLKGFTGKLWIEDPAELNMIRELRSLRARTNFQTLNDAANQLSKPPLPTPKQIAKLEEQGLFHPEDYAPDHWQPLALTKSNDPRLALISPLFEGKHFDPLVAEKLNRLISLDAMPGIENRYLRYMDAAYNDVITNWKGTALNFSPAYWTKNVGGALWNAFVDGMYDVTKFGTARKLIRGELKENLVLNGKLYSTDMLNQMRRDLGLGLGFTTVEGAGLYEKKMPLLYRIPAVGKVARKMFAVNQLTENTIRFGHFLGLIDKGVSIPEAISRVKTAQFDYLTGLTDFERLLKKYGMPFYTWTRFNVPFQVQGLIKNPRPYIHLAQVLKMTKDTPAENRLDKYEMLLPDYLKNMGIPTRIEEDGKVSVQVWGGWIPASDLELLMSPKTALGKAAQMVNPVLQQITGQVANYDSFYNKKIEEFEGQTGKFMGVDMRKRLIYFLKTIRPLQDADRVFTAYMDQRETLDERQYKAIRQFLRTLHGVPSYKVDVGDLYRRRKLQIQDLRKERVKYLRKHDYSNAHEIEQLIRDLQEGL